MFEMALTLLQADMAQMEKEALRNIQLFFSYSLFFMIKEEQELEYAATQENYYENKRKQTLFIASSKGMNLKPSSAPLDGSWMWSVSAQMEIRMKAQGQEQEAGEEKSLQIEIQRKPGSRTLFLMEAEEWELKKQGAEVEVKRGRNRARRKEKILKALGWPLFPSLLNI